LRTEFPAAEIPFDIFTLESISNEMADQILIPEGEK